MTRRRCPLCEDAAWIVHTGDTHPDNLVARLHVKRETLLVHLRRHGHVDLVDRINLRGAA